MSSFRLFGLDHLLLLAGLACLCVLVVWLGRQSAARRPLGRGLGLLLLTYGIATVVHQGMSGTLTWATSLPLHLCHLVVIACIVGLFRPSQLVAEIAYFLGMAGTLQALATPELSQGFPSWQFIEFFWSHGGSLLAVAFFVTAPGFRPRSGSVLRMFALINVYAVSVGAVDWLFGWNYGYLRRPPSQPTLIDHLGEWPWYLLSMEGIALLSFLLLALPWTFVGGSGEHAERGRLRELEGLSIPQRRSGSPEPGV